LQDLKNLTEQYKDIKVLYVENEKDAREQMLNIFDTIFTSIDIAVNSKEALAIYKSKSYDLILVGINMPHMNGLELVKNIRKESETQKIIIISAYNKSNLLLESINLGIDGYLTKPVAMKELKHVLLKMAHLIHAENIFSTYKQELEQEVERKTAKLAKQLIRDDLTGLLNRKALQIALKQHKEKIILLLNIDNFDAINTTSGYASADIFLQHIAHFLESKLIDTAHLYYLGADEFVCLLSNLDLQKAKDYVLFLQSELNNYEFIVEGFHIKSTVGIGIAKGSENLLENAHIALREARLKGINSTYIFSPDSYFSTMQSKTKEIMPLLREAIAKRYIVPYFQPIVNNQTKKIEKYESLARIVDAQENIYQPFNFIPVAELTGMLPEVTKIMIDKTFEKFQNSDFGFSVNISEYDLRDDYLLEYMRDMLHKYNINPSNVALEVLEGVSAQGVATSIAKLQDLKKLGFCISIDDFGTENSNFERVHQLNVEFIKIDGKFIKDIDTNEKSYNISKTISEFAHAMNAKVIAEFVHNEAVFDKVLELGIEYSQGYYFYKPNTKLVDEV